MRGELETKPLQLTRPAAEPEQNRKLANKGAIPFMKKRVRLAIQTLARQTQLQVKMLEVVFLSGLASSTGQAAEPISKWDAGLLQLELRDVHIRGNSLAETWQEITRTFGIRTILLQPGQKTPAQDAKFAFDSEKCPCGHTAESRHQCVPGLHLYAGQENRHYLVAPENFSLSSGFWT